MKGTGQGIGSTVEFQVLVTTGLPLLLVPCGHRGATPGTQLLWAWAGASGLHLCSHRVRLLLGLASVGLDASSMAMFSEQAAQRAHTLLSPPSASNATFDRIPVVTYTNSSQPFRLGERSFNRQYAHIYATRLVQMRPFLVSRARQRWGK